MPNALCPHREKYVRIFIGGDGGIGKTTLCNTLCKRTFQNQNITVGVDVHIKKFKIKENEFILQIWDMGGQEQFRFILPEFMKSIDGYIIGFDCTRRKSLIDVKEWIELVKNSTSIPKILMATKKDIGYHPTITPELLDTIKRSNIFTSFAEISAKTYENVELPFKLLIKEIKKCEIDEIQFVDE